MEGRSCSDRLGAARCLPAALARASALEEGASENAGLGAGVARPAEGPERPSDADAGAGAYLPPLVVGIGRCCSSLADPFRHSGKTSSTVATLPHTLHGRHHQSGQCSEDPVLRVLRPPAAEPARGLLRRPRGLCEAVGACGQQWEEEVFGSGPGFERGIAGPVGGPTAVGRCPVPAVAAACRRRELPNEVVAQPIPSRLWMPGCLLADDAVALPNCRALRDALRAERRRCPVLPLGPADQRAARPALGDLGRLRLSAGARRSRRLVCAFEPLLPPPVLHRASVYHPDGLDRCHCGVHGDGQVGCFRRWRVDHLRFLLALQIL
mmetsp:Transcript_98059/g.256011  ORF Transcript_98059/g.256011 Transcript_98059/m.256011 type:complete len:323 (-) Transcript_98059:261-1229(-)